MLPPAEISDLQRLLARSAREGRPYLVPAGSAEAEPRQRAWAVVHAAEYARPMLPLLESQLTAGMRPFLVTPYGAGAAESFLQARASEKPPNSSLLRAWHDVRNWRRSLLDCDLERRAEIVHAHSFAAGMAAVRNCPAVVYDLRHFVEENDETHPVDSSPWMTRSFRVAEQFVISRSGAVVVHSAALRPQVLERGADPQALFVVPDPVEISDFELPPDEEWLSSLFERRPEVVLYPADFACGLQQDQLPDAARALLRAFTLLHQEMESACLLLPCPPERWEALQHEVSAAGMKNAVRLLDELDAQRALASADIVIVGSGPQPGPNLHAIAALAAGRTLLAADVPGNRDVTDEGRGCVWFKENDADDLAHRARFLAENPDFRRSLAASGRRHIIESRGLAAVGRRYDEVYRCAWARRRNSTGNAPLGGLEPLSVAL